MSDALAAAIPNFAMVDADLWRGARPDRAGAVLLAHRGVKTAINLEWEQSDDDAFAGLPVKLVRLADFEPIPLVAPWLADQHVVDFIATLRREAKPAFVHCRSGQNRTGVAVAAYRLLVKREAIDAVIADFDSYGGAWQWGDNQYLRTLPPRAGELMARIASAI